MRRRITNGILSYPRLEISGYRKTVAVTCAKPWNNDGANNSNREETVGPSGKKNSIEAATVGEEASLA